MRGSLVWRFCRLAILQVNLQKRLNSQVEEGLIFFLNSFFFKKNPNNTNKRETDLLWPSRKSDLHQDWIRKSHIRCAAARNWLSHQFMMMGFLNFLPEIKLLNCVDANLGWKSRREFRFALGFLILVQSSACKLSFLYLEESGFRGRLLLFDHSRCYRVYQFRSSSCCGRDPSCWFVHLKCTLNWWMGLQSCNPH